MLTGVDISSMLSAFRGYGTIGFKGRDGVMVPKHGLTRR
jgi:hypothetical protein